VLERLPEDHPQRRQLRDALVGLADALCATQRDDGGWLAVIGDADSGPESSTAAFVAAGFAAAVSHGLLGREYLEPAQAAWAHTASRVGTSGVLEGVSANVWACTEPSHYRSVPPGGLVPWGQGPLLLAAARMHEAGRG
jgi:unsaturated rhamnogalacturonyl hydrolase